MGKYIITIITENNPKKKHRTRLHDILTDKGVNQTKLVEETKLMHGQVSLMVQGLQTDMLLSTAKRICNYLEVSLDEVWGEGVVDSKSQFLKYLDREIEKLDVNDVHGKLWLDKVKKFVLTITI